MTQKIKQALFLFFTSFLFGGVFGFLAGHKINFPIPVKNHDIIKNNTAYIRQNNSTFLHIKPLLDSEFINKEDGAKYYPYEQKIIDVVTKKIKDNPNIKASFYFNDLTNLSWVGINEKQKYKMGSLFKVPIMLAYYKLLELDPSILIKQLTYSGEDLNKTRLIQSTNTIDPGVSYSVDELIKKMNISSDNNAAYVLAENQQQAFVNIFSDLNIPIFPNNLSPEDNSLFFRILFNASYLNPKNSEEALQLLINSEFKDGIIAGVPQNIEVAHKFGEATQDQVYGKINVDSYEFHDCGIVYQPTKPYVICVMTEGNNPTNQHNLVKDISALVYSEVIDQ